MLLSAIAFTPLSTVLTNVDYSFFNTARLFPETSAVLQYEGCAISDFYTLNNVIDVSVENKALTFLTHSKPNDFLNSTLTNKFNYYNNDTTVAVISSNTIPTNFLLTSPFESSFQYNVIPLKSARGTNEEYDYRKVAQNTISREYDAIYQNHNSSIVAQYKADTTPVIFKTDSYSPLYIPDRIASFSLSSAGFVENGSIAGNCPANSDLVLLDRYDTDFNSHNFNGLPLCSWLDINVWKERWYDPNKISQGNALLPIVNTTSAINPVLDIISTTHIHPKNKMTYLRHGPERNLNYINSLSANIIFQIDEWSARIKYGDIETFAVPSFPNETFSELQMDGTFHFHMPPTNDLHQSSNITAGLWVYQDAWNKGIDTQYFGNFSNGEGYGLFYNTGANSQLLTFPTLSGSIYGFNNKGIKVFEKSIGTSLNLSACSINKITTDFFGIRWMYDDTNKQIYQLDVDDLIKVIIPLPNNAHISKMHISKNNNLYIFNTTNQTISGFDSTGMHVGNNTNAGRYNNFVFDLNNTLKLDFADHINVDSQNNIFKINGINLYKNNILYYHVGERVSSMQIDSNDNIWILRKNKLLKLNNAGFKVFDNTYSLFDNLTDYSQEMGFVKSIKNKTDYDTLWMIFNSLNYIIQVDINGNIIKRINIKDVVNLKLCGQVNTNVHGEFTNYDITRKYSVVNNSVISSTNPAITCRINLNCGTSRKIIQIHYSPAQLQDWNHIAFTHEIHNANTYISLYVNGTLVNQQIISGIFFINYGSLVSPFIIGGHSGKLGARNVEISLNNEGYFQGKINDLRLYDRTLNIYELLALAKNIYYSKWNDMTWYMPTPVTTHMEEIQFYNLNRYKGHKSNKFNIRLKNLNILDADTQNTITATIKSIIGKISPVNTELNEVIFE